MYQNIYILRYPQVHMYTCAYVHIHTYVHMCIRTLAYICTHVHMYTYICTYVHTYTYTILCDHTCIQIHIHCINACHDVYKSCICRCICRYTMLYTWDHWNEEDLQTYTLIHNYLYTITYAMCLLVCIDTYSLTCTYNVTWEHEM